ncbi:unnamed protein product [Allacma fusca]|uniref:Uncharacterized protein n=1 Tax=Allacma fusca TaxID=39272 RepID=A0A8J2J8K2_9HEXA|nr:unnamed protein product [Allacma fusca]
MEAKLPKKAQSLFKINILTLKLFTSLELRLSATREQTWPQARIFRQFLERLASSNLRFVAKLQGYLGVDRVGELLLHQNNERFQKTPGVLIAKESDRANIIAAIKVFDDENGKAVKTLPMDSLWRLEDHPWEAVGAATGLGGGSLWLGCPNLCCVVMIGYGLSLGNARTVLPGLESWVERSVSTVQWGTHGVQDWTRGWWLRYAADCRRGEYPPLHNVTNTRRTHGPGDGVSNGTAAGGGVVEVGWDREREREGREEWKGNLEWSKRRRRVGSGVGRRKYSWDIHANTYTEATKLTDPAGSFGAELAEMSHKQQSGLDKDSIRKVESLANQIASNPLTISASDYFHVDRKLFTTIISTITTYLIILVQNRTVE